MANKPAVISFGSLADLHQADTAIMNVMVNGQPSGWLWTFAGPSHPVTLAQADKASRKRLREEAAEHQQRANGRKVKVEADTPDAVRAENVAFVVERLLDWSPVEIGSELVTFSPEAATRFLADSALSHMLVQAMEFLAEDASFIKRSA